MEQKSVEQKGETPGQVLPEFIVVEAKYVNLAKELLRVSPMYGE